MKHLVFVILIALVSCKSDSTKAKFVPQSDTTKVQALYLDFSDSLRIKNGIVFEIVRDIIDVDSVLQVNTGKDTLFFYNPAKDSVNTWAATKRPAISTVRDVDSAIAQLRSFAVKIREKQDSLNKGPKRPK